MKRMLMFFLAALISVSFVGAALAIEQGNKRKGKYIYRKVYKACNERGEVDTPKPPLNPDAKTQAQWTQVFEQGKFDEFGCKPEWEQLSEEDKSNIYTYLYAHASDSPTPLKCK